MAQEFSKLPGMMLVAGRYEGLDERVIESRIDREVSVGDYVLSGVNSGAGGHRCGGEVVARGPGDERSAVEESFDKGLLDWPHYTRPVEFEGRTVPEVLQGGHHADIQRWRLKQAVARTMVAPAGFDCTGRIAGRCGETPRRISR
jgi:tRNA (guanine37-N1)-methyltransferase